MALQSKLMGLALETEESTSACMFAFIRKFTEAAKRQAQNERIKARLENTEHWDAKNPFELNLAEEMGYAEEMKELIESNEMSNLLHKFETIPRQETFSGRLAHHYYDTKVVEIGNMARFNGGQILVENVFSQMADENVISLVQHMLVNQKHHSELRQLHYMFNNVYWKDRLTSLKKMCPTWDVITIPNNVGLIQFTQLCLQRMSILQRKSPVVECFMKCFVYRGKSPKKNAISYGSTINMLIGNRYFIHEDREEDAYPDEEPLTDSDDDYIYDERNMHGNHGRRGDVHIAEICRDGDSVSIIPSIAQFENDGSTAFILVEPFLIRYSYEQMEAVFIPSSPDMLSKEFQFEDSVLAVLQPIVADSGNLKEAKTRLYPVITKISLTEESRTRRPYTCIRHLFEGCTVHKLRLFNISVYNEVNITVVWQSDLPEGHLVDRSFCTNNVCCTFIMRDKYSGYKTIYYFRFDEMKIKSISFEAVDGLEQFGYPGDTDAIYLVQYDVFYTLRLDYESQDEDFGETDDNKWLLCHNLLKFDFDGIVNVEEEVEEDEQIQNIQKYVSRSYDTKNNTVDIVGRNFYRVHRSDEIHRKYQGKTTMIFLDKYIEYNQEPLNNHQDRETSFDYHRFDCDKMSRYTPTGRLRRDFPKKYKTTPKGLVEGTTVFPNRIMPSSGSCLIDVAQVYEGVRFQIYKDDETLLQSEINQCLFGNNNE